LRDGYDFLPLEGDVSEDELESRCVLLCLKETISCSTSESLPRVSYSEMGKCRVRIFLTSESVLPKLSDSWLSGSLSRPPFLLTFVYSGSFYDTVKKSDSLYKKQFYSYYVSAFVRVAGLEIVVDEGALNRVVWAAVDIAAVGAFAVGVLGQLERSVRANVLWVILKQ
jgi:hypothetical protein